MTTESPYVLAIDLGTSAVKVAVISPIGRVVTSSSELHRAVLGSDGTSEQDANEWWASIGRCARAAVAQSGQAPSVIAVTSQFVNLAHAQFTVDKKRWPNLAAYVDKMMARPSFAGLIAEEKALFGG